MNSTVPTGPSVLMTDGFSVCVPSPGIEIWSIPVNGEGTLDAPQQPKRIYPYLGPDVGGG